MFIEPSHVALILASGVAQFSSNPARGVRRLLEPPVKAVTGVLWVGPPAVLAGAGIALAIAPAVPPPFHAAMPPDRLDATQRSIVAGVLQGARRWRLYWINCSGCLGRR